MTAKADEQPLTIKDAAVRLAVDRRTLSRAIKLGQVKAIKIGGTYRVPAAEIRRLLEANQTKA